MIDIQNVLKSKRATDKGGSSIILFLIF